MIAYQPGDILLTADGFGVLSIIVQLCTRSRASHATIVTPDGTAVIEAVLPRVRRSPLPRNVVAVLRSPDAARAFAAACYAQQRLGLRYNLLIDAAIGLRLLTRLPIPWQRFHGTICSALVTDCWRQAGLSLLDTTPSKSISPADLLGTPAVIWRCGV